MPYHDRGRLRRQAAKYLVTQRLDDIPRHQTFVIPMTKIAVGTVDIAVGRRLQNDEAGLNHWNQQFRQYPVKQFRKFGKFGKYWTTVVVAPFFTCSTDFMLNSGFAFKFSRPDRLPG
jgi:hypothetical protein